MEQTIQNINIGFYKAFESLSLERMEEVWKHSDDVVCVHPGWDLFKGVFFILLIMLFALIAVAVYMRKKNR